MPGDDPRMFTKYFLNIFADFKPEDTPFRPEAAQAFGRHMQTTTADQAPTARCFPAGIPMGDLLPLPRRFIHTPGLLAILYEGINPQRMIYTDGRKLPVDPQPAWLGYSVGSWDGDVLVVESSGYSDRSWLDGIGHARSEATRITERIRRRDFGHLEVDVTIDDPRTYTQAVLDSLHANARRPTRTSSSTSARRTRKTARTSLRSSAAFLGGCHGRYREMCAPGVLRARSARAAITASTAASTARRCGTSRSCAAAAGTPGAAEPDRENPAAA